MPTMNSVGAADISALYLRQFSLLKTQARSLGYDLHTSEDAAQDVLVRLLRQGRLHELCALPWPHQQASLRVRLRCHLSNRWRDSRRQRRGGTLVFVPLIQDDGTVLEVADERAMPPGHHAWFSEARLTCALRRLRHELRPRAWLQVRPYLEGGESGVRPQRQSPATRVALFRARQRLRELLEE